MLEIFNSISKDIQFTAETAEDFKDGRIPTLDFSMWMDKVQGENKPHNKIRYMYYEKSMARNTVILESSSLNWISKRTSLSQDLVRRMINTDRTLEQTIKNTIINE